MRLAYTLLLPVAVIIGMVTAVKTIVAPRVVADPVLAMYMLALILSIFGILLAATARLVMRRTI